MRVIQEFSDMFTYLLLYFKDIWSKSGNLLFGENMKSKCNKHIPDFANYMRMAVALVVRDQLIWQIKELNFFTQIQS